jgi:hypothetical protein
MHWAKLHAEKNESVNKLINLYTCRWGPVEGVSNVEMVQITWFNMFSIGVPLAEDLIISDSMVTFLCTVFI